MTTENYSKYILEGNDYYKIIPEITSEVMWAISCDKSRGFTTGRFTTSKEIKKGLGDYIFEGDGDPVAVKIQVFNNLPRVGEDIECSEISDNLFIDYGTVNNCHADYFVNIILDEDDSIDKIIIVNWEKFVSTQQIIFSQGVDQPFENIEEHTVTLSMCRDFNSDLTLCIMPFENFPDSITRKGRDIIEEVIAYKRGY